MKKIIVSILAACLAFCMLSCGENSSVGSSEISSPISDASSNADSSLAADASSEVSSTVDEAPLPTTLDTIEYAIYQNIFYNDQAGDYVDKTVTKIGTFAILEDSYNDLTRYYVWGYNDETKCCDWQWEFVPKNKDELPSPGSMVEMEGKLVKSEDALDGYWFEDASVKVKEAYTDSGCDMELTTMSGTLERVQIYNISAYPERYEGKTIRAYGRISGTNEIKDPYYDGTWKQSFSSNDTQPAIGTMVILNGVCKNGVISDCSITQTSQY